MNSKSNYILCNLVEKFGENDFSLWTIDISEVDYKAAMTDFVRAEGKPADVLNGLPIVESKTGNVLHFMFSNLAQSEIISTEVSNEFIVRYLDQGCSVRGSLQNILDELKDINHFTEEKESVIQKIRDAAIKPAPPRKTSTKKQEPEL